MFVLLKIIFIFCCVALVFAAMGDLALFLLIRGGPVGIKFGSVQAFNRIPVFVLSTLWVLSALLGWIIARKLHLIPHL